MRGLVKFILGAAIGDNRQRPGIPFAPISGSNYEIGKRLLHEYT